MSRGRLITRVAMVSTMVVASVTFVGSAAAQASSVCASRVASDFNGDGRADVAVGYGLRDSTAGQRGLVTEQSWCSRRGRTR